MSEQLSPRLATLLSKVQTTGAQLNHDRIQQAIDLAQEAYQHRTHWSGQTVIEHVSSVLEILLQFQPDEDAIISCILLNILSTDEWTLVDLEQRFGPKVRALVSGVHLLSHVTLQGRRRSIEDLRIMLLTVSDDVRTLLIILCDRCHLLRQVDKLPAEDRRRLCLDALNLFAPVAARLGIYSMKHELESYAFPVLYPNDAERIHDQISQMDERHGDFLDRSAGEIVEYLGQFGVQAEIYGRRKQPYSIFSKMRQKSLSHIDDVYDYYALRVIVSSIEECYSTLGLLHRLGRPLANRFKDFISFPKPNGYQSLHTTLMQLPGTTGDEFVEVQVRTKEMHREAEYGIAAHWSYKEYGSTALALEQAQLHQMLANQELLQEDAGPRLVDHIFILTPKGDVMELPEGSTPLDFAFQVHTELGLSFRGARVNGAMVPVNYQLENGDVVEILKHSTPRPSPQWLQLLHVGSARAKLKRYLYAQERPQLVSRGKQLVNEQLKKYRHSPLDTDLSLLREVDGASLNFTQREDILMKIGQGAERAAGLMERLSLDKPTKQKNSAKTSVAPAVNKPAVEVAGGVPMPTRFAQCCKPDKQKKKGGVTGVIHRDGHVLVHRKDCRLIQNGNKDRRIVVKWKRS